MHQSYYNLGALNGLFCKIKRDMRKNMGGLDKIIRVILALVAGLLVYFEVVNDIVAYMLLILAAIFVLTSLIGFCPLYGVFGLDSCDRKMD